jgi:hypothetical protein
LSDAFHHKNSASVPTGRLRTTATTASHGGSIPRNAPYDASTRIIAEIIVIARYDSLCMITRQNDLDNPQEDKEGADMNIST